MQLLLQKVLLRLFQKVKDLLLKLRVLDQTLAECLWVQEERCLGFPRGRYPWHLAKLSQSCP